MTGTDKANLSINVSISYYCRTDIDEGRVISRGTDRQTDTVLESSHGNMSAHKMFQLKAQN